MDTRKAIKAFDALSQETRLKAFRFLAEAGRDGVAAGVLAEQLKVPHNTLSFHLANLSQAGLITSKRKGRSIIYQARLDKVHELTQFMVEKVCVVDFMDVLNHSDTATEIIEDKPTKKQPVKKAEQVKKTEKTEKSPQKADKPPKEEKATADVVKKLSKEIVKKAPETDSKGQMSMF